MTGIELNNGVVVPQLGFGTYKIPPEATATAVAAALAAGYRHIDTAQMYGNEAAVAAGIERSGVDPAGVFVTSKLLPAHHRYDDALAAFDATLQRLRADTIDLFLIHWPLPGIADYAGTWRALERIHQEGRARAIGVSNFEISHLEHLRENTETTPAVNQIELHPYLIQADLRAYGATHDIVTEAWSPIARGRVLAEPVVGSIAARLGRTPAQVVIRWHLQLGNVVIPKTVHPERMDENFGVFDFELSPEDAAAISALDRNGRIGPHPDRMNHTG
jgi:2,5-diketo-D-gluconate reductase A